MGKACSRMVRPIAGVQLGKVVEGTKDGRTVFVKFASHFCGACQESKAAIAEALTKTCAEVMEVDSDVAGNTADANRVEHLPTVIAFRNGREVGRVSEALSPDKYRAFFERHNKG